MSKQTRGFTLTEAVVVIAIISALGAITYPFATSLIARSRETTCLGNLRALGVGLQAAIDDAGGQLPELQTGRSSKNENVPVLETFLSSYTDQEMFHCPADRKQFAKTGSSYFWNSTLNGKYLSQLSFFGIRDQLDRIPLISDKESWHPNGTNFLYADLSASSKERFSAGH